jgi:formylglycine-generating enzyme required for sulfatase activity
MLYAFMNYTNKNWIIIIPIILLFSCAIPFRPEDISNQMVLIQSEGSCFLMGFENGMDNEKPVHSVQFTYNFLISNTEVTQKEYISVMKANPSHFKGKNLPVEMISWFDAVLYCNEKSKKEGFDTIYTYNEIFINPGIGCYNLKDLEIHYKKNGYRLPTEAEWEYACRGGSQTEYFWGDNYDSTTISKYAWYNNNSDNKTHPVGTKLPNQYDLYDMGGNVWEWCNDSYEIYREEDQIDPIILTNTYWGRVIRGSNWSSLPPPEIGYRVSFRYFETPYITSSCIGFRIARTL